MTTRKEVRETDKPTTDKPPTGEPQKSVIEQIDININAGIKESKDYPDVKKKDTDIIKDEYRKTMYSENLKTLAGVELTKENAVETLEKVRELRTAIYTIETKGKTKEEIKKMNTDKKKNRVLFDLFTSPVVKNRHVWIPISAETLIVNQDKFTGTDGIQNISEILENTTSSYIHTLFSKCGLEIVEKSGGRGFTAIKNRKTEEIVSAMTDEQKEEMIKLLSA